jgi:hypothetical protein
VLSGQWKAVRGNPGQREKFDVTVYRFVCCQKGQKHEREGRKGSPRFAKENWKNKNNIANGRRGHKEHVARE